MKFQRTVRTIIVGALLVLLLLFFSGIFPITLPLAFFERVFFAPLYTSVARQSFIHTTIENTHLRATLRDIVGSEWEEKERTEQAADIRVLTEWAATRGFPEPIIATALSQYEEDGTLLFVLNRGERDGVREGAIGVLEKGVVAGRIVRTTAHASLLRLVTAKEHKFSARLDIPEQTPGLLSGKGEEETLLMRFVPEELPAEKYTLIVTSGLDAHVPRGLLLGIVQEARILESTPWKELVVTPLLRPVDLRVVGILHE